MAQKKSAKPKKKPKQQTMAQRSAAGKREYVPLRGIFAGICLVLALLALFACLGTQGVVLHGLEALLSGLVGRAGFYLSPLLLSFLFYLLVFPRKKTILWRCLAVIAFWIGVGAVAQQFCRMETLPAGIGMVAELYRRGMVGQSGGVLGGLVGLLFFKAVGKVPSVIFLLPLLTLALLGAFDITIPGIVRAVRNLPRPERPEPERPREEPAVRVVNHLANKRMDYVEQARKKRQLAEIDLPVDGAPQPRKPKQKPDTIQTEKMAEPVEFSPVAEEPVSPLPEEPVVTRQEAQESAREVAREIEESAMAEKPEYRFPPVELLQANKSSQSDSTTEMRDNSHRLAEALQSFHIDARICNVTRGPSVTRYEIELAQGVRLNKVMALQDDFALALGASSVRISAIPDKIAVVGVEVPNKQVTTVGLREVIDSPAFRKARSKSSFAVGKDIGGACVVGNIAKLPHMLIAGTTGSGKSVCMNSIIISLLYKAKPEDVRLIMVDPKMVELGIYNGIPHLLIPVVTDPKKAAGSLQWAVVEMMRRYKTMSDAGVRDLDSFNSLMESTGEGEKLPQIVVIIDELADLMLVAAKEVEESICRIAQMGRAAGMHLIIATQRPSADVITGLMKANIPSRIAFAVASAMESRIILDTQGAEKLVGRGDMLYAPLGNGKPQRIQGCFVSDGEVEAVTSYVKENSVADYSMSVLEEIEQKAAQSGKSGKNAGWDDTPEDDGGMEGDEKLPEAVEVILETGQASVSMLQRRLKLGYARAARIVDEMEEKGIVGPFSGSKPREILITREQWQQMHTGQMSLEDTDDSAEEPM